MPSRSTRTRLAQQLGSRIRELRSEAGLTQERLAWSCDLTKPFLSQIESGKRLPSLGTVTKIADRLDVDVPDLFVFDPSDPKAQLLEAVRHRDVAAVKRALAALELA